jgi:hypothetical protein
MALGSIHDSHSSGLQPSNFEIREDGTVKLANGRVFKVEIDNGGSPTSLGKNHTALTQMIIGILQQTQQDEGFTYKDLSETVITREGVQTNQKELSERQITVIKPENFTETYQNITSTAQKIFEAMPQFSGPNLADKSSLSTVVESPSRDSVGRDTPEPIVDQTSSSTVDSTVPNSSEGRTRTITPLLSVTVEENTSSPHQIKFKEVAGSTDRVAEKALKEQKQNAFVRTLTAGLEKVNDWFKSIFSKSEETVSFHKEVTPEKVDQEDATTETPQLDKKQKVSEYASFELPKKIMTKVTFKDGTEKYYNPDADLSKLENVKKIKHNIKVPVPGIPLEELDKIVSDAIRIGGKIKIREGAEPDSLVLRAGRREKGLGIRTDASGESSEALALVFGSVETAVQSFNEKKDPFQQAVLFYKKSLPAIDDRSSCSDRDLSDWIHQAENFEKLAKNPNIQGFIDAARDLKADPQSAENKSQLVDAAAILKTSLNEQSDEIETKIKEQLSVFNDELKLIHSILNRLENDIPWSKDVLKSNAILAGRVGSNKQSLQTAQKALTEIQTYISPKEKSWVSRDQALTDLIDPKNAEFRKTFMNNYRWYLSTPALFTFFESTFKNNQEELTQLRTVDPMDTDKVGAIENKQKVILEILSDWAKQPRVNPKETDSKTSDEGKSVKEIIDEIIEMAEGEDLYEEQVSNLKISVANPKALPTVPAPNESASSFIEQFTALHTTSLNPFDTTKKKFVNNYANELTKLFRNQLRTVQTSEVARLAWSKDRKYTEAPNISESITLFNKVNSAITHQILTVPDGKGGRRNATKKEAGKLIAFFIDVQTKCVKQGELNSAMAIQSALNSSSIARLKGSWSLVDTTQLEKFESNSSLLNPELSYKMLRGYVESTENSSAYMGMFLTDLAFIDEGNPTEKKITTDEMDENNEEIQWNLGKLEMIESATQKIIDSQGDGKMETPEYDLPGDIVKLSQKSEQELYDISLAVNPREKKQ